MALIEEKFCVPVCLSASRLGIVAGSLGRRNSRLMKIGNGLYGTGEVMLVGVTGERRGDDQQWDCTLTFMASQDHQMYGGDLFEVMYPLSDLVLALAGE